MLPAGPSELDLFRSASGRAIIMPLTDRPWEAIVTPGAGLDVFDLIPKVELHCHVEGTVRSSTVVELARKAGRALPVDDPEQLYRYDSLDSFLAVFWLVQEVLVEPGDWARIAYESLIDGAAHGLRYREMFFTPARHLAAGQDLDAIVVGLTEGIESAEAATGVRCMLIADIDKAYGPEAGIGARRSARRASPVRSGGAGDRSRRGLDRAGHRSPVILQAIPRGGPVRASKDLPRRRGGRRRAGQHQHRPRRPGGGADRPRRRHRRGSGADASAGRTAHPAHRLPDQQRRHREPVPVARGAPAGRHAGRPVCS